mmetsp:Transcript_22798/g.25731  ORF Transcript_22798/g.25731 Transcript_22798/m.25731 type:complete len:87 (+) Transcript_22798:128-388(+)
MPHKKGLVQKAHRKECEKKEKRALMLGICFRLIYFLDFFLESFLGADSSLADFSVLFIMLLINLTSSVKKALTILSRTASPVKTPP